MTAGSRSGCHAPDTRPLGQSAGNDSEEYELSCSEDGELSYMSEESDGELDWDPDRERLLRTLRQTGGDLHASRPLGSHAATVSSKSLAERRNEWRAARGLAPQKSVAELIAERRAAREESRASTAARSGDSSGANADQEPWSADRALELGGGDGLAVRTSSLTGWKPLESGATAEDATPENSARDSKGQPGSRKKASIASFPVAS